MVLVNQAAGPGLVIMKLEAEALAREGLCTVVR